MEIQIGLHIKLPRTENKTSDFVNFVYLTQVISYLVLYDMACRICKKMLSPG